MRSTLGPDQKSLLHLSRKCRRGDIRSLQEFERHFREVIMVKMFKTTTFGEVVHAIATIKPALRTQPSLSLQVALPPRRVRFEAQKLPGWQCSALVSSASADRIRKSHGNLDRGEIDLPNAGETKELPNRRNNRAKHLWEHKRDCQLATISTQETY